MILSFKINSQPTTFIKHYGDTLDLVASKIVQDKQGNFLILAMEGDSQQWWFNKQVIIKTDPFGNLIFKKTLNFDTCYFFDVTPTFDSCYVLVGGYQLGDFAYKIDSNGDSVWAYNYPPVFPSTGGSLKSVSENLDHKLWVCGEYPIVFQYCCGGYYFSIDSTGVSSNYASTGYGRGVNVEHDLDSNVYIQYESIPGSVISAGLKKITRFGASIYDKIVCGGMLPRYVVPLNDKSVLTGGFPFGFPYPGFLAFKTDSSGNSNFIKNLDYPTFVIFGFNHDCGNGYTLSGYSHLSSTDTTCNPLIYFYNDSIDSTGSFEYNLPADDEIFSFIRTNDSAFAMVGSTTSFGNGEKDVLFIKTDCNGGFTALNETSFQEPILKVFPNPAHSFLNIILNFEGEQQIDLRLFNMLGEQLVSTKQKVDSSFNQTLNLNNFSDGIYFLQIILNGKILTDKFIVSGQN